MSAKRLADDFIGKATRTAEIDFPYYGYFKLHRNVVRNGVALIEGSVDKQTWVVLITI